MASVLNEFETGPVEGLQPIAMRDPNFLKLTPGDKVILANFYSSPAYAVIMKLMEGEVEKAETDHLKSWRDEVLFQRTGIFAVAMRIFMERVQMEVNRQVEEFAGEVDFARNKKKELETSPEEQILQEFK
jgi:hypothetical protein